MLQDIDSWETALKHAAGSHKSLVHAVEHLKRQLEESEARFQQEHATHRALWTPPAHRCMNSWLTMEKAAHCCQQTISPLSRFADIAWCVVAEEGIRQMSLVTSQLKGVTAALSSREASIGRLKISQARLSSQVTEQRDYIQELQAKLMAALREVGRCTMMKLQTLWLAPQYTLYPLEDQTAGPNLRVCFEQEQQRMWAASTKASQD